jgi:hypothetical protein
MILKNVLLKWGMRPTDGRTEYQSGDNVRATATSKTSRGFRRTEAPARLVYQMPEENLGGGFVFPSTYSGPSRRSMSSSTCR